jgi:hypothetical protein
MSFLGGLFIGLLMCVCVCIAVFPSTTCANDYWQIELCCCEFHIYTDLRFLRHLCNRIKFHCCRRYSCNCRKKRTKVLPIEINYTEQHIIIINPYDNVYKIGTASKVLPN